MEITIKDNAEPSELVIQALTEHLPYSIPVLRRLQFMDTPGGRKTPHSHVLSTFDTGAPGRDFLIAFLDMSRAADTAMWLYSSLQHPKDPGDPAVCEQQVLGLVSRVRDFEKAYEGQRKTPGVVLIGSVHKKIFHLLQKHSLVQAQTPEHFKFLFRVKDLPPGRELPDGLSWSMIRPADIPLVLSRTSIPYEARLMKMNPSASIETSAGVPIAWAFIGPDGSLKVLHCEEDYRGRGYAKAVVLKLFHDRSKDLVQDGLYHADVDVGNLQSQGVCRSLNGTTDWSSYWVWIRLS